MAVRPEDLAEALMTRYRVARAKEVIRAQTVRQALDAAMVDAQRNGTVTRAWLIGSLAHGNFGAGSDVDVVVEGLAREQFSATWAALVEQLDADVDLLRIEDLPPAFKARVLEEGAILVG